MKVILYFFFILLNFNTLASNKIPIEQGALEYFISKLDTIHLLCFDYRSFDTLQGKIFLRNKTFDKARIYSNSLERKPLIDFITPDSLLRFGISDAFIQPDTGFVKLVSNKHSFIKLVNKLPKSDLLSQNDLAIYMSCKFTLKNYYIVRIMIACKSERTFDDIYIKLDLNGKPISYVQSSWTQ